MRLLLQTVAMVLFSVLAILGSFRAEGWKIVGVAVVALVVLTVGLSPYWGGLRRFIQPVLFVIGGLILILIGLGVASDREAAEVSGRLLLAGIVTAGLLMPPCLDPLLLLLCSAKRESSATQAGAGIALLLFRNRLLSILHDVQFGSRLALSQGPRSLVESLKVAGLVGVSLAARIPIMSQELLSAVLVSHFDFCLGEVLEPAGKRYYGSLVGGSLILGGILV